MALSESVEASLKEAEQSLRNALAFAARQERPMVCSTIAEMIGKIESVIHTDEILGKVIDFFRCVDILTLESNII